MALNRKLDTESESDRLLTHKQLEKEKLEPRPWWRGAVIYQVYPRSFQDSNGDGIGDIRGLIQRLDYVASLGVDAIWLSPFFKSPMKDFGYDIDDYRQVDSIFGTIEDFDELVAQCKSRDLKLIIDQVVNHTSDQHLWFQESRSSKTNSKADWYVWADANDDGSPPNNWMSIFGGSAWEWDETRQQYYFHNFLSSQPDLNFHSKELREQILSEFKFWLDRGVDGFRLDAINFCFHDKSLQDNPLKPEGERIGRGFTADNPYAAQYHVYDNTQPENLEFLRSVRELMNAYPEVVTLGEINSDNSMLTLAEYTSGDELLNMGYNFELLADEFSPKYIAETVQSLESVLGDGWPCWAISNHDVERVVSRWGGVQHASDFAKMTLTLTASLRGSLCVYQGEELGLAQAEIPEEKIVDPYGIAFWPEFKGRDGCRTPMPWDSSEKNAGFSKGEPWLPVAVEHLEQDVIVQDQDQNSVLNYYRNFLSWRKQQSLLQDAEIKIHESAADILVFERFSQNQSLYVIFNLSSHDQIWVNNLAGRENLAMQLVGPSNGVSLSNHNKIKLKPYGFAFFTQLTR